MALGVLIYVLLILFVSYFATRKIRGVKDFYVAGQKMPWYIILGTYVSANVSAALFLGFTNLIAGFGWTLWCAFVSTSAGYFLGLGVTAPLARRLANHYEIYTLTDFFATRFSSMEKWIRIAMSLIVLFGFIPYITVQSIAISAVIASVFKISFVTALLVGVGIVVVYTVFGGMYAVVWTDFVQFLVIIVTLLVALPVTMASLGHGSMSAGWATVLQQAKPTMFKFVAPQWGIALVVGQLIVWTFANPIEPHMITRGLTARSEKDIYKAFPLAMVAQLFIYAGIVPLSVAAGMLVKIPKNGYSMIELATKVMNPALGSLILAGILAASMSTASTQIAVASQAISRDFLEKLIGREIEEKTKLVVARTVVAIISIGVLVIALGNPPQIYFLAKWAATIFGSAFFIPFILGAVWSRVNGKAVFVSMILSVAATISVDVYNSVHKTTYFYDGMVAGMLMSILSVVVLSLLIKPTEDEKKVWRLLRTKPTEENILTTGAPSVEGSL